MEEAAGLGESRFTIEHSNREQIGMMSRILYVVCRSNKMRTTMFL